MADAIGGCTLLVELALDELTRLTKVDDVAHPLHPTEPECVVFRVPRDVGFVVKYALSVAMRHVFGCTGMRIGGASFTN